MIIDDINLEFDESILHPHGDEIVRPVYTMPLQELRLRDFCKANGMVCYLPLKKVWKVNKQRHGEREYQYPKEVLKPMFPSYIFVKMNPEERSLIYRSKAVAQILSMPKSSEPGFLKEVELVHRLEQIALHQELDFNAELKEGDKFLIESGPWTGIYGWLVKKEKRFIWTIEIECLDQLVQATIDPSEYKMTPVPNDEVMQ